MTEYVKKGDVLTALYMADAITVKGIEILNAMPAEDVIPQKEEKPKVGEEDDKIKLVDVKALRDALYEADAVTMRGLSIIDNFPTIETRNKSSDDAVNASNEVKK